uniref:Heterogeneous nuclear ribonucleoprotein 87F-like n=1 Tax=Oryzias melastigma TaxID=30732 RepID=A0A3B3BQF1_ORYME
MLFCISLSENERVVPKKEMLWCVPKSHKKFLSQFYVLCHGLFVTGLNSYMNDGYIKAYFKQWGNVISCKVTIEKLHSCQLLSFSICLTATVKFSAEYEADLANWSGPHIIGGLEVEIRQFVCPKVSGKPMRQKILTPSG